jgi:hypothetical protein
MINLGILLPALLVAGQAKASMLEQMDTAALTKQSRWIHIGEVTSSWSSPDASNKMIYTYVKLRVDQTLKGQPVQEVLIRVPGGRLKDLGMVVHGMAHFTRGERTLVFLGQDRDGAPSVVGMAQGKYRIFKSSLSGEDMAMFQAPSNLEIMRRTPNGPMRQVVATEVERRVSLKSLLSEIQSAMTEPQVAH